MKQNCQIGTMKENQITADAGNAGNTQWLDNIHVKRKH